MNFSSQNLALCTVGLLMLAYLFERVGNTIKENAAKNLEVAEKAKKAADAAVLAADVPTAAAQKAADDAAKAVTTAGTDKTEAAETAKILSYVSFGLLLLAALTAFGSSAAAGWTGLPILAAAGAYITSELLKSGGKVFGATTGPGSTTEILNYVSYGMLWLAVILAAIASYNRMEDTSEFPWARAAAGFFVLGLVVKSSGDLFAADDSTKFSLSIVDLVCYFVALTLAGCQIASDVTTMKLARQGGSGDPLISNFDYDYY